MKLAYTAYDGRGQSVTGTMECPDATAAAEVLRGRGLFLADLAEAETAFAAPRHKAARRFGRRQTLKRVAVLTRQLCVLTSSGTPLVDALGSLDRQTPAGPWKDMLVGLRLRVERGEALSEAMSAYPGVFDPATCSLVTAGEHSGKLPQMLDRLATLKRRQLAVFNTVVGALIYPCLLVAVSTTIFILLLTFIVPRFASLFASLDVPLPASTQVLLRASQVLRTTWPVLVVLLAAGVFGLVAGLRRPAGRRLRDTLVLKVPFVGSVIKGFATARICRLLGVLLNGQVPLLQALSLVRSAAANVHYQDLVSKACDQVARGEPLSQAFSDPWLVSPSVHEAIRSGEQSGQLDRLLLEIAGFLDEENEVIVRSLTSILEPVILIVMGLVVGAVAVSMFLPLFDLTAMTQGGRL